MTADLRTLLVWSLVILTPHTPVGASPRVASQAGQVRGRSGARPAPTQGTGARRAATMSTALVQTLVALGRERTSFPDVGRRTGRSARFEVVSSRQVIAKGSGLAAQTGESFTPPALRDEVNVRCWGSPYRPRFECTRVVVRLPDDTFVQPLTSASTLETFHDDRGATWEGLTASATYTAATLRGGFSVTGFDRDGTSWTFVVTAEDASDNLLLAVQAPAPPRR